MKRNSDIKVRIENELIDIFTHLPKSTNTAMSWLLLHKSMKESLKSERNLMEFNLLDFIDDYEIEYSRRYDLKKELVRDFEKLENKVKVESTNDKGNKQTETYFFFQKTTIDHETLDVKIKLNEDIYNSVSSVPEKKYFQYLKKEAIMIANKRMTPNDIKLLMYLKSQSHNKKVSYVKIDIEELYTILGKSHKMYFATLKERYLEPFIERALGNTNYVISYKVQKNRLNKRKLESLLFTVDNRKEAVSHALIEMKKDTPQSEKKAQHIFETIEPEIKSMNNHEQRVINNIELKKEKQEINKAIENSSENKDNIIKDDIFKNLQKEENNSFEKTQVIEEN